MLSDLEIQAYYDTLDMPVANQVLFDREYLIPLHKRREEFAMAKWRKALRALRWYRLVPFVRAVFVSGSLSINNTDELSDFDLIIVAKHGRIWLVRAMTLILFQMLGVLRRHIHHAGHAPDKICPNHYITDRSLAIPFQDVYTAQLYANLAPVIVRDLALIENFKKENDWVTEYFPWDMDMSKILPPGNLYTVFEWILGNHLEWVAKKYQLYRIEHNRITPVPGGHLICNDDMLAFHSGSSAGKIIEEYQANMRKL